MPDKVFFELETVNGISRKSGHLEERTFASLIKLGNEKMNNDLINKEIIKLSFMDGPEECHIDCDNDVLYAFSELESTQQSFKFKILTKDRVANPEVTQQSTLLTSCIYTT